MKRALALIVCLLAFVSANAFAKSVIVAVIIDTNPKLAQFKVSKHVSDMLGKLGNSPAADLAGVWKIGGGDTAVASIAPMTGPDRANLQRTVEAGGTKKGLKRAPGDLDEALGIAPTYLVPLKGNADFADSTLAVILVAGAPLSMDDAGLVGEFQANGLALHVVALGDDADAAPLRAVASAAGGMVYRAAAPADLAGALERVMANLERARLGQPPLADSAAAPVAPVVVPTAPVEPAVPVEPTQPTAVPVAPTEVKPVPTTPSAVPPQPTTPPVAVKPVAVAKPVETTPSAATDKPKAPAKDGPKAPTSGAKVKPKPSAAAEEDDEEDPEAIEAELAKLEAEKDARRVEREAAEAAMATAASTSPSTPWWLWVSYGVSGLVTVLFVVWLIRRRRGSGDDEVDEGPASSGGKFNVGGYFESGVAKDEAPAPAPARGAAARAAPPAPARPAAPARPSAAVFDEPLERPASAAKSRPATGGGPAVAWFTALGPGPERFEFRSDQEVFTIGRKSTNDVTIVHQGVSGFHAELRWVDGQLTVIDKNSTNGTFVNNRRVRDCPLNPGDIMRFDAIGYRIAGETVAVGGGSGGGQIDKTRMVSRDRLRDEM